MSEYYLVNKSTTINERGERQRTITYMVWDESTSFDDADAIAAIPIYRRVTRHPDDANAIANTADAKQVNGSLGLWQVDYNFSSAPLDSGVDSASADPDDAGGEVSPELRPWKISSKGLAVVEPMLIDAQGNVMVASNGQRLEGCNRTRYDDVITITGYLPKATTDIIAQKKFMGSINNGAWQGWPSKCLLCRDVAFSTTFQFDDRFFEFTAEFQFKTDTDDANNFKTWHPVKYMDRGSYVFESMSKPPQAVKDAEGNPTHDLMPLDGAGQQLTCTQILAEAFVYIDSYPYDEKDWTTFLT